MNIAVMGAGGVGGFYGAKLANAGHSVTFIARGGHLAALRGRGLRVEGDLASIQLPHVEATDDPASVGPVELVLLTTKAYDLEGAAGQMLPMIGPDTAVLPLLNGADIAERIEGVIGAERVLGGLVQVSARVAEPGLIRQMGPLNKIIFGEFSGAVTPRVEAIRAALESADVSVEVSATIRAEIWKKYLFIAACGGVCAVTGCLLGPVLTHPETRALYEGCVAELAALADKQGVGLSATVVADTMAFSDGLPAETRPSMLYSLEQGQKLEVEVLNGSAVRMGRDLGVATPINAFLYAALKLRADGQPRT